MKVLAGTGFRSNLHAFFLDIAFERKEGSAQVERQGQFEIIWRETPTVRSNIFSRLYHPDSQCILITIYRPRQALRPRDLPEGADDVDLITGREGKHDGQATPGGVRFDKRRVSGSRRFPGTDLARRLTLSPRRGDCVKCVSRQRDEKAARKHLPI